MPKLNNCQNGTVYILFIEVYLIEKSKLVPEQFSLELVGQALNLSVSESIPKRVRTHTFLIHTGLMALQ